MKRIIRNQHIDALRGVAIILVVLGHALQTYLKDMDSNLLFRYIYSFHMPLFMFISGYVTFGKNIDIRKKFLTLAVPFFAWYQVQYLLHSVIFQEHLKYVPYMVQLLVSPDFGLWFLWVLFLNFLYLKIVLTYTNLSSHYGDVIGVVAGCLLLQATQLNALGIGFAKVFFVFFAGGYLFPKYAPNIPYKKISKIIVIIGFLILGSLWYRLSPPIAWETFIVGWHSIHLHGATNLLPLYEFIVPVLGIGACYSLVPKNGGWWYQILAWLGTLTMEIYVIHAYILVGFGTGLFQIISATVIAIIGSILLASMMKKSRLLDSIFFGGR